MKSFGKLGNPLPVDVLTKPVWLNVKSLMVLEDVDNIATLQNLSPSATT